VRKLLLLAVILILACFAAMTVYAVMTRAPSAPVVFEAEQQHSAFDEAGMPHFSNRQVVSYLADGTRVVEWQARWMQFVGLTARTVLRPDGQQDAYMYPLPIPLKTTTNMTILAMRKAFPAYARTCTVTPGEKMVREEMFQGYRTTVIERFEPQTGMRILYWHAVDAACTTLKTEIYKNTGSGWRLSYGLNTLRVTPAATSTPALSRLF
jgi:hypothetical protein